MPSISLHDAARGLEQFGDRFDALDVFVDDLPEAFSARFGEVPPGWTRVESNAFDVPINGKTYRLTLLKPQGVARLSRTPANSSAGSDGAFLGALAGAALGAASKKPEGVFGGALLGLLVGAVLGNANSSEAQPPRRVLTMQFDPLTLQWRAYTGPLVPYLKDAMVGG